MDVVHAFQCQHNGVLVVLSYVISVLGAYCALQSAMRIPGTKGGALAGWLTAAAVAMGGGAIWAMHFIAMLACRLPVPVGYDQGLTLASLLAAVLVTGLGLFIVSRGARSVAKLLVAGTITGLGVAAMHYTGMAAMRLPARTTYSATLVTASIGIAIVAATAALWLAFNLHGKWQRFGSAFVMGLAVCGMHYTAMAAASFVPTGEPMPYSRSNLERDELGLLVFGATAVVLALILMFTAIGRPQPGEEPASA